MIGKRLGRWLVMEEIGQGGMGTVYLAQAVDTPADRALPDGPTAGEVRRAAVKVLAPALAGEPGFVERFAREIAALSKLRHPNIVGFLESGQQDYCYYYAMEYVEGVSFDRLLREKGRLPCEQVVDFGIQICAALKHAHDHGVIHRDLKPPNLMLAPGGVVKLTDFGVARLFSEGRLTASNAVVGTADFMSPEQAAGKPVTRRSDLYSLGVLLYTLLTGKTPFTATTVAEMLHKHLYGRYEEVRRLRPETPHELEALVHQLLEKDPDKRPPDASVVGRQLDRLKQKTARKSQATMDEVQSATTLLADATDAPDAAQSTRSSNPAKVVSRIMRTDFEEVNRAGPIGRLFNRAWVLLLLLAGIITLAVWGFWPASVADEIARAQRHYANLEYEEAAAILERQLTRSMSETERETIEELRERIEQVRARNKARKQAVKWAGEFTVPSCEAERLYREGVLEYYQGRTAAARSRWQLAVDAYRGVAIAETWVLLSGDALRDTIEALDDSTNLDAALKLAESEPADEAQRRLDALERVYQGRDDVHAEAARRQINAARQRLRLTD